VERLFVYGTLAPGEKNFHLVENINGHWESATCVGRIFTQTKGAHVGLPCFELRIDGERVDGKILSSTELIHHWGMLDKFEGELYQRRLIPVRTEQGEELEAYVYAHIDAIPYTSPSTQNR
jgi:gamma-glutamylcyclotransferase (GGCT)/AIG2-like uncharacterized protein YtfP